MTKSMTVATLSRMLSLTTSSPVISISNPENCALMRMLPEYASSSKSLPKRIFPLMMSFRIYSPTKLKTSLSTSMKRILPLSRKSKQILTPKIWKNWPVLLLIPCPVSSIRTALSVLVHLSQALRIWHVPSRKHRLPSKLAKYSIPNVPLSAMTTLVLPVWSISFRPLCAICS